MKNKLKVVSYAPAMFNFSGHSYRYHLAIHEALRRCNVSYEVAIPIDSVIKDDFLDSVLYVNHDNEKRLRMVQNRLLRFILKFFSDFNKIKQCTNHFVKRKDPDDKIIVFFEQSSPIELLLFYFLYKVRRIKLEKILFVVRGEHQGINLFALKICNYALNSKIKLLHLMTDSVLVSRHMEKLMGCDFDVIPIPHTNIEKKSPDFTTGVRLWLPGYPGLEKGLNTIKSMLSLQPNTKTNYTLYISSEAGLSSKNMTIYNLNPILDDEKYRNMFSISNLLIFPYLDTKKGYALRTSGPFVEAIISGSMVLVNKGTWMEFELLKYNLNELVIDWEQCVSDGIIFSVIDKIKSNKEIIRKLNIMSRDYTKFHSVECMKNYLTKYLI